MLSVLQRQIPWSGKQAIDERVLLVFPMENKDVLCMENIQREQGEKGRKKEGGKEEWQEIKCQLKCSKKKKKNPNHKCIPVKLYVCCLYV